MFRLVFLRFVVLLQDFLMVLQVGIEFLKVSLELILVAQHFAVVLLDLAGQQVQAGDVVAVTRLGQHQAVGAENHFAYHRDAANGVLQTRSAQALYISIVRVAFRRVTQLGQDLELVPTRTQLVQGALQFTVFGLATDQGWVGGAGQRLVLQLDQLHPAIRAVIALGRRRVEYRERALAIAQPITLDLGLDATVEFLEVEVRVIGYQHYLQFR